MAWYNPFSWGASDPEKYDRGSTSARAARNLEHADYLQSQMREGVNDVERRRAAEAARVGVGSASTMRGATIDRSQQDQFRQGQLGLMDSLAQKASGQGPFMSDVAMQRAGEQNLSNQLAMAAGARGSQAASAARQARFNATNFGQQIASEGAQQRMAEQAQAQGLLGSLAGQARGQDIGLATSQAGFMQDASRANMDATNQFRLSQAQLDASRNQFNAGQQNQMTAQNDQARLQYLAQLYGMDAAEMQARMQQEQLYAGQLDPGSEGWFAPLLGSATQAGGTMGAAAIMSDVNTKTRIRPRSAGHIIAGAVGKGMEDLATVYAYKKMMDDRASKAAADQALKVGKQKIEGYDPNDPAAIRRDGEDWLAGMVAQNRVPSYIDTDDVLNVYQPPVGGLTYSDSKTKEDARKAGFMDALRALVPKPAEPSANVDMTQRMYDLHPNGVMMSDERTKEAKRMLDHLRPYEYEYNGLGLSKGMAPGRHVGVMAQQLEKSPLGREMVLEDTDGTKMVDYGSHGSTFMAALAALNQEVEDLKKKRRK